MTRYLGVDLAWGSGSARRPANETGLAAIDDRGVVLAAGWARGVDEVAEWVAYLAEPGMVVAIDAPLVVHNQTGQRRCETEVGQRYMHPWKVAANSSNLAKSDLAGVALRVQLERAGIAYVDGLSPHDGLASVMFECYPYTTIVGAEDLGYDVRPQYKRPARGMAPELRRAHRARECDDLIARMRRLAAASTPLLLDSHPITRELLEPSPLDDRAYKHREDLLDATLAAWTAAVWAREPGRTQVLGATDAPDVQGRRPTIVALAKPAQRRRAG